MSTKGFTGFSRKALAFLEDLKANNNRDWFNNNKKTYETEIKRPVVLFSTIMIEGLTDLTGQPHTSKIYRIHRDVRFAKDKTPYNTHIHISFTPEISQIRPPSWFFGLDTEGLTLGAGIFAFDKAGLDGFRKRVAGPDGAELSRLLGKLEGKNIRLSKPELKRVPTSYPKDHPHAEHLCRKGLSAWIDLGGPDQATRTDLVGICSTSFDRLKPVSDWLMGQRTDHAENKERR